VAETRDIELAYKDVKPLRTAPCLAWMIQYEGGKEDVLLTAPSMPVEDVIEMVKHHCHSDFTVRSLTVGMWPLHNGPELTEYEHQYSWFMGDARGVDQDGMVQL
jgi:hypothetical protein